MIRSLVAIVAVSAATTSAFSPSSVRSSPRPSSSLLHVGTTMPSPQEHTGSSFQDENHLQHHEHAVQMPPGVHAPITAINSPQELADFLQQDDRICVIKFHAAWCKSCQRFGLKFQGLANQKTDWIEDATANVVEEGPLRFGSIEFGANTGMCRKLQIKRLPTVHFYQKGQKMDGFPCGPSKFPMLLEKIEQYLQAEANASLEQILQQGEELMSSEEVAGVLQQLILQDADGSLDSGKNAKSSRNNNQKSWWNIMP